MPGNKRVFVEDTVTTASKEQQVQTHNEAVAKQAADALREQEAGRESAKQDLLQQRADMPGNKRFFVTDTVTTASKDQQTSGRNAAAKSNKVSRTDPIATTAEAPRIRSTSLSWDSSALVPSVKLQKEDLNPRASPKASPAVTQENDAVIQIPQTNRNRALPQMQPEMELRSSQV